MERAMRHVKAVVIIVAIASAVMAVGVAPASASKFRTSVGSAALDGTQIGSHVMEIEGIKVTCTTAEFTGVSDPSGASDTQEVAPNFSGCTAPGWSTATVKTTGCRFLFYANTSQVDLTSCTAGKKGGVVVTVTGFTATCEVEVFNQVNINNVSYGNMMPRTQFTVQLNSTNIDYIVQVDTFNCPLKPVGTQGVDGKYTGLSGVQANGGKADIWLE
jgi:hypothetical protein